MCASTEMIVMILMLPVVASGLGVVALVLLARALERRRRARFSRAGLEYDARWPVAARAVREA
jgi:hypothetical protein